MPINQLACSTINQFASQQLQRVDRRELEPEDWAVLSAVLREAM